MDESGHGHTVKHPDLFLNGCNVHYHVGEEIAVRYLPDDPAVLMTQNEIDNLPGTLILYGVMDLIPLAAITLVVWLFLIPSGIRVRRELWPLPGARVNVPTH
jgi:hypothetical protein